MGRNQRLLKRSHAQLTLFSKILVIAGVGSAFGIALSGTINEIIKMFVTPDSSRAPNVATGQIFAERLGTRISYVTQNQAKWLDLTFYAFIMFIVVAIAIFLILIIKDFLYRRKNNTSEML